MCGLVVWQLQPPRKTGDPAVGYALSCLLLSGPKRPREAQRGPEKPKEPQRHRDSQRGPERPREAQRGPERPREAQRASERHRDAQRGPERPREPIVHMYVERPRMSERG